MVRRATEGCEELKCPVNYLKKEAVLFLIMKNPHNLDELVALVNYNDEVIGKATRDEVHSKGLLHRETYCYLINSKNQVLLQRRKDNLLWDHSSAGHFPFNQTYEEGIVREFEEELGIKLPKKYFKEIAKEKISLSRIKNIRIVKVFLVKKDIALEKFKIDTAELSEIKYFNKYELKKLLLSDELTLSAKYLIDKYILPLLK